MVAGPPVEVQVRVLDWLSKVKLVTLGKPAWIYKKEIWQIVKYQQSLAFIVYVYQCLAKYEDDSCLLADSPAACQHLLDMADHRLH